MGSETQRTSVTTGGVVAWGAFGRGAVPPVAATAPAGMATRPASSTAAQDRTYVTTFAAGAMPRTDPHSKRKKPFLFRLPTELAVGLALKSCATTGEHPAIRHALHSIRPADRRSTPVRAVPPFSAGACSRPAEIRLAYVSAAV